MKIRIRKFFISVIFSVLCMCMAIVVFDSPGIQGAHKTTVLTSEVSSYAKMHNCHEISRFQTWVNTQGRLRSYTIPGQTNVVYTGKRINTESTLHSKATLYASNYYNMYFYDGSHICGGECLNCGALNDENLRGSYHSGL